MIRIANSGGIALALALCITTCGPVASAEVAVVLLADRTAAAPGETVNLALKFTIPEGSFIFWQHSGGKGTPTTVEWSARPDANFGELRYPVPQKQGIGSGAAANVLVGEPVLLSTVHVPDEAKPGQEILIEGVVTYAVGIAGDDEIAALGALSVADVALRLAVASPGEASEPANQEVFEEAGYSMPVPAAKARHIKFQSGLKPAKVSAGGSAELTFEVQVKKGFHIQAHEPGVEGLVGADLFVVPPEGITVGEAVYPKGKSRKVKYLGTVREYGGQVRFVVPVTVGGEFVGPASVTGLLLYQGCNDKTGMCYPPEYVEWSVAIGAVK